MKSSLKSFFLILASCFALSLALALFNGRSAAAFVNLGSYVGAGVMLLGCWRLTQKPGEAIEQLHMHQRVENFHADLSGRSQPYQDVVPMYLASGPLAFAGMLWLLVLQVVRYGFGISLD